MANIDRLAQLRKMAQKNMAAAPAAQDAPEPEVAAGQQETAAGEEAPPMAAERPKPGWVSPKYSLSRAVQLSPEAVLANRGIIFDGEPATVDAYKILRTQILQKLQQSGGNTIMVTSAVAAEGKTTTAINLAFTFAKEFRQTVLLVDCDLQQQRIHKHLGYESDKGLIDYLLDDCPVTDLFTWPGVEKISIISGGRTIRESSELLGAPRMQELIDDMKSRYPDRYVIFDVQSILTGADALVFAPLVDHVLVVVEEGKTPLKDIKKTVDMLPKGKLLGLMLNRHRAA